MPCCEDFWEWFCDLVIKSEEADPFSEDDEGLFTFQLYVYISVSISCLFTFKSEGESLPVARTSNLSGDQGRFKRERMKQLFNRHGYNLAVFPGGNIKGKLLLT